MLPIAIYYEHPHWFQPLFRELERRSVPYTCINPLRCMYDLSEQRPPYSLVVNRMSPSAYLRGGSQGIFFTLHWLCHLERLKIPVVNNFKAYSYEISKARQLDLLAQLGLSFPKTYVINHPSQTLAAAEGLRFPIVIKANIGGSGAGIVRYDNIDSLHDAVASGTINLGIDSTALMQEYVPARGQQIIRLETLGRKFLYAIRVHLSGESFNLCPADICQRADGVELARAACPVDAPKSGLKVESFQPPLRLIEAVERIVEQAEIDVGGVEYMVDDRDGQVLFYDINALSNFVADAVNVVGFDPFARLVDYLLQRAQTI